MIYPIVFHSQIRDRLPNLKAIVQFTKEVTEKDPMIYDVSMISLTLFTLMYIVIYYAPQSTTYHSGNS